VTARVKAGKVRRAIVGGPEAQKLHATTHGPHSATRRCGTHRYNLHPEPFVSWAELKKQRKAAS
jgi:hypothetical protein